MFSFSKIETFKKCKYNYKLRYIDKIKVEKKNEALIFGSNIHYILEDTSRIDEFDKSSREYNVAYNFINSPLGEDILKTNGVVEYEFFLDDKCAPTDKDNGNFVGYIDRINVKNDKVELIDFKTGKYKDQIYQNFAQLITYSIFIFQRYPDIKSIVLRFVYVEHLKENTLVLKRESLDIYKNELLSDIDFINNEKIFEKTYTKLCGWCDYKDICINE